MNVSGKRYRRKGEHAMTQREIEKKLLAVKRGLVTRIVGAPLAAVLIAFALGIVLGQVFISFLVLLVVVAGAGVAAYVFAPRSNQPFDDREAEDSGPIHRP
jgi:uncharacterized membrane protein